MRFTFCLNVLLFGSSSAWSQENDVWAQVRAGYSTNLESVVTLDITADLTCGILNHGKKFGPGESTDVGRGTVSGCRLALHWIKDGQKEFIEVIPQHTDGPPDPVCMMVDEIHSRRILFEGRVSKAIFQSVNRESVEWELRGVNGANPLLEGFGLNTVATIIDRVTPLSTESVEVDGSACLKVEFGNVQLPTTTGRPFEYNLTAWFELTKHGLKRVEMQGVKYPDVRREMVVSRLTQFGDVWLPESFELIAGKDTGHFTQANLATVKVNSPVDPIAFAVPKNYTKVDLVNVDKKTDVARFQKKRTELDGTEARGKAAAKEMVEAHARNAKASAETVLPSPGGVNAIPQSQNSTALWLAIGGIVVLVCSTIMVFRRT